MRGKNKTDLENIDDSEIFMILENTVRDGISGALSATFEVSEG